jgi:hypothetical protein
MTDDLNLLAKALAVVDNRPAHPEDYTEPITNAIKLVSRGLLAERVYFLYYNPAMCPGGFSSCEHFLLTGDLLDEYTGQPVALRFTVARQAALANDPRRSVEDMEDVRGVMLETYSHAVKHGREGDAVASSVMAEVMAWVMGIVDVGSKSADTLDGALAISRNRRENTPE